MMASNLISRLLPSASDEPLEGFNTRRHSNTTHTDPAGHRNDMDIDEENLEARFEAQDLENLLADASDSHMTTESTAFLPATEDHKAHGRPSVNTHNRLPSWQDPSPPRPTPMFDDDDVPESLLLEGSPNVERASPNRRRAAPDGLPPPVPGPSTRQTQAQWDATRRYQRLHEEGQGAALRPGWGELTRNGHLTVDPKQKALWLWANVSDLDAFLGEVYAYYTGCGIYSILLRRLLTLLQTVFVVGFITFLGWCVDYKRIPQSHKMSEVVVSKCTKNMHGFWLFALWGFILFCLYTFARLVLDIPRLKSMHDFYHHLLDIPDRDIQTVQWQKVVGRIMALRDLNLTTAANLSPEARKLLGHDSRQRLDAVDIASRLMRQDNYMIALFNKEILDVSIPIPFFGNRYAFSETTSWHVRLAILDFVFSGPGNTFNKDFLKVANRKELVKRLQNRLFWVGIISIIYAPFSVVFFLTSYIFRYFSEYHKDPSQLSTRDFTPFAQWKFREFNELPHLFTRRKNMAYPYANHYLAQFPKDKTEQAAAFIAFVAGAFAFVLFIITIFDSEFFLNFEITPGTTALFWIGLFSAVYRVARSSSPQDGQVADPEYYIQHVIYHTHYEPASWKDRLHTDEVRAEFTELYQPKVLIFAEEILSMVITPFLLIFRLPHSSTRIVDFFREFSIVVDGVGVVCSYSMFGFNKNVENVVNQGSQPRRENPDVREDYLNAKDDKMVKSYFGFVETYTLNGGGKPQPRAFHPPPQFPNAFGAMSQSGQPIEASMRVNSKDPLGRHRNTSRFPNTGRDRDEPMNSMLLDPHHQPSASALRGSPRTGPHVRYRSPLHPVPDHPGLSRHNSRIEEESMLGDSWRTGRFADVDEGGPPDTEGKSKGGVLHLLQQYSKAQTEGRGVKVGI